VTASVSILREDDLSNPRGATRSMTLLSKDITYTHISIYLYPSTYVNAKRNQLLIHNSLMTTLPLHILVHNECR